MALSPEALEVRRKYIREYMRKYRKKNKIDDKYWERKAKEKEQAQRQLKADISMFELAGYYSSDNK